jgi:hypothetical protein
MEKAGVPISMVLLAQSQPTNNMHVLPGDSLIGPWTSGGSAAGSSLFGPRTGHVPDAGHRSLSASGVAVLKLAVNAARQRGHLLMLTEGHDPGATQGGERGLVAASAGMGKTHDGLGCTDWPDAVPAGQTVSDVVNDG